MKNVDLTRHLLNAVCKFNTILVFTYCVHSYYFGCTPVHHSVNHLHLIDLVHVMFINRKLSKFSQSFQY